MVQRLNAKLSDGGRRYVDFVMRLPREQQRGLVEHLGPGSYKVKMPSDPVTALAELKKAVTSNKKRPSKTDVKEKTAENDPNAKPEGASASAKAAPTESASQLSDELIAVARTDQEPAKFGSEFSEPEIAGPGNRKEEVLTQWDIDKAILIRIIETCNNGEDPRVVEVARRFKLETDNPDPLTEVIDIVLGFVDGVTIHKYNAKGTSLLSLRSPEEREQMPKHEPRLPTQPLTRYKASLAIKILLAVAMNNGPTTKQEISEQADPHRDQWDLNRNIFRIANRGYLTIISKKDPLLVDISTEELRTMVLSDPDRVKTMMMETVNYQPQAVEDTNS